MKDARRFPKTPQTSAFHIKPARLEEKDESEKRRKINKDHLINKLNYTNFQGRSILVIFKHPVYGQSISIPAKPLPCYKDILDCLWTDTKGLQGKLNNYKFDGLRIPDGQKLISVQPEVLGFSEKGIRFRLPEICWELRNRRIQRYECHGVKARLIQNSVVLSGRLVDFNANIFRIEVTAIPPQTFQWIYPESKANLIFSDDHQTLYSGESRILRQTLGQKTRTFVLEPTEKTIRRFEPKQFRSHRQVFDPLPDINFNHPLTGRFVSLKVQSLSGSGFSVEEDKDHAVLLPGLILPEVELSFANSFKIKCFVQVLYQQSMDGDENTGKVRCGLALLDMDMEDHSRFLALLNQAKDKHTYIGNIVDPDALWRFFFETGFIYPEKYAFVHANKEKIKATYEKLYTKSPRIARHFVNQKNGRILGHLSIVRYHGNSWMIHHHAANKTESNRAGIIVLSQIHHYLNDTYKLYSAHLDLVFCYFRPENKFPSRVFGGATRNMKNPKGCSVDTFAYLHCKKGFYNELDLPGPWELSKSNGADLAELESYYEYISGGLMIDALGLRLDTAFEDLVNNEYQQLGFKKERHLFSLRMSGKLKAVVVISIADIGLNLSDLTNCIQIIVIDPEQLTRSVLQSMIYLLFSKFDLMEMPVMIYPVDFAESRSISFEKQYTLWVLNLHHLDSYFRFIHRLMRQI